MKQIYLVILLTALVKLNAQTLTQSFNEPAVGDIDRHYRLDTSAYTSGMPISVTGSNCAWNFSHLAGVFPIVVDSFIAPASAPSASAYPGATYVQHRDALYSFYKSSSSPQQTELLGAYTPTLTVTFTNSGIIAGYPVNYGYNLSDPVGGTFKYNTTNGVCIGNIVISADGLGTMSLPNNVSVANVLRLKSVESLTLSAGIIPVGTFSQTIINYYKPGVKFPILNLNYSAYQLLAGTPTITAYAYGSDNFFSIQGIREASLSESGFTAFPNPFHDHLFISAKDVQEEAEFLFYNLSGQLVLRTGNAADPGAEKLDAGIYLLEIKNRSGSFHQKLIKE